MSEKTISLTEALLLKKRYKSKIDKLSSSLSSSFKLVTGTIIQGPINREDVKDIYGNDVKKLTADVKSSFQSMESLIENYKVLCRAINLANAITIVEIFGEEFTISEVIGMKGASFDILYSNIYKTLKENDLRLTNCITELNFKELSQEKMQEYVKAVVRVEKPELKEVIAAEEQFENKFKFSKVDIFDDVDTLIDRYKSLSEEFEDVINFKLSEINSRTMINVVLKD